MMHILQIFNKIFEEKFLIFGSACKINDKYKKVAYNIKEDEKIGTK
jgi:hypothetical protein